MGIYYFAVDYSRKEQMWAPRSFSDKCIYHPHHPLPQMIVMKNCQGCNFEIVNDVSTYDEHEFKDVTDDVYKELKEKFPNFNWDLYENFDYKPYEKDGTIYCRECKNESIACVCMGDEEGLCYET